ncbi:DUF3014 domain-containing protein [Thioalkalivibrio sp. XN8]|uniref:DUF3014 domain-containing protein n=1 Tax=Thioalkalivibrio sp. XN8 TaxID=2712863 RepID=UPI0013E9F6B6|nr:DUF3014 domain-containing protein [Thioalkalivibrio sp. XN8]NGP52367.1 DUF3014 domain-containing protein [Thioalkalivibrio sp. XN8]
MHKHLLWGVLALAVIGLVAFCYPRPVDEVGPPPPVSPALPPAPPSASEFTPLETPPPEPAPEFVAEPEPEAPPLPPLDESDPVARAALAEAAGPALVEQHLAQDEVVRKLVATVDNLTRDGLWIQARVVPPLGGQFLAAGEEESLRIAEANYRRYDPLFALIEAVDVAALAAAYQRHYPLLQQAYEELGYPGRQFHNRALAVIDHLLATPQVDGPVALVRPHVLYKFADPALEALSPGQKVLLRVGPENAAIARASLIQLRAELEGLAGPPDAD